ncbi:thioredoxin [Natronosalvus vescus]|uniref:thioredoxin n=1 Tax=Natronosalvus vescus TaxID=2953881 RepID=UPI0020902EC6|nr:thioredoxin [Natronosalvus vescus]
MATDAHSGSPVQSTDEPVYIDGGAHLQDVVSDHEVVLVDFFATWCGPCKMLDPVLEGLADETDAVIAKVDVDQHQPLAAEFGVRGVPTMVVFANGEQVEQHVGVLPEPQLRTLIEGYTSE